MQVVTVCIFQLPVITDLRNPCLKPRHWSLIEEVIEHRFEPDVSLTLNFLEGLQVFDFAEAIQEISGQASSEASLEAILKKVKLFGLYYHCRNSMYPDDRSSRTELLNCMEYCNQLPGSRLPKNH